MTKRLIIAVLISTGVLLVSQQKIGPFVGLRLPIYDNLKRGYWYFKPNPNQFQIDPDPAGTSDGIWSLKPGGPGIPGKTLVPGGSITFSPITGFDSLLLDIDRRNVLHWIVRVPPPELGSPCEGNDLAGVVLSDAYYLCLANDTDNNGTWVRVAIEKKLVIITTELPAGKVGEPFHVILTATGGIRPYRWSIDPPNSLPPGLTLTQEVDDGIISGIPTTVGSYAFDVVVSDSGKLPATAAVGVEIR